MKQLSLAILFALLLAWPAAAQDAVPSSVIEVVGNTVTFDWTPATGPVVEYVVFVNRNGAGYPGAPEYDTPVTSITVDGTIGETIMVRVAARDIDHNRGPFSLDSTTLRFVAAPVPLGTPGRPLHRASE